MPAKKKKDQEVVAKEPEVPQQTIATEINLITRGLVKINGETYTAGMGLIVYPGESCTCEYLEETDTFVIKVPGPLNDKYVL